MLWVIYWLFKLTEGKEGMGYGDFKLLAALGAWMGWKALLPIVFAVVARGPQSSASRWIVLARRGRESPFPLVRISRRQEMIMMLTVIDHAVASAALMAFCFQRRPNGWRVAASASPRSVRCFRIGALRWSTPI